ncbi:MAG: murein biosynthesis integral membrane protein MurJ [Gemmatimonadales bacterium]|jgi:putative peptidoglycan lipid II flippase
MKAAPRRSGAALVAAGIFLSRILGLVRTHYLSGALGQSIDADAWVYASRIPMFLNNLFGEGSLSASFIPVYAGLVRDGDDVEAGRTAGAVAAALGLVVAVGVALGVTFAGPITTVIASGLNAPGKEATRALTIHLTRILFPSAGLVLMCAWCLGVLNSHRRFFMSYAVQGISNLVVITALLLFRHNASLEYIVIRVAWASVVGAAAMFLVQLPRVLKLVPRLRLSLDFSHGPTRVVLRNALPAFVGRGVNQISGFIDLWIASYLPSTLAGLLGYSQNLYMLPVSLFGMSISAAELAEMSHVHGEVGDEAYTATLRSRLDTGLRRIAFLVVPSAMAFFALGGVIVALIFEGGRFNRAATELTWSIVAGSGVGLLASTLGRLYSSTYYVLRDTKTPLAFATVRVILTTVLGWLFAIYLPRWIGLDAKWGAAGLTASAGVAAWVEFTLLRRALNQRIGRTGLRQSFVALLWLSAGVSAAVAWGLKLLLPDHRPIVAGTLVVAVYGLVYFAATAAFRIPESRQMIARARRMLSLA